MGLRFHYENDSWDYDSLTGVEVTALEDKLACRYVELQPGLKMRDTLAIYATFLSRKLSEDRVEKIVKKLTLKDINSIWTWEEDNLPTEFVDGIPKVTVPTTGTGSSSSSPGRRGTGPRQSRGNSHSET